MSIGYHKRQLQFRRMMNIKIRKKAIFVLVLVCTFSFLCINFLLPVRSHVSTEGFYFKARVSGFINPDQRTDSGSVSYKLPFKPPLKSNEVRTNVDFNIDRVFVFNHKIDRPSRAVSKIPKIIHFMWKNEYIPSVFVENLISFYKLNPDWRYYFWTDKATEQFLRDYYPKIHDFLGDYNMNVSKSDAVRYTVIYHFGGAYFDLDTRCLKPLDVIINDEECVLTPEPMEHAAVVTHRPSLLANCMMACKPKHDFFKHVLSKLRGTRQSSHFMDAAGPIFFDKALNSFINLYQRGLYYSNDTLHVMPNELFLDYVKPDVLHILSNNCDGNYFINRDNRQLLIVRR